MFLCGFPTELANIIDFAQDKSNKKLAKPDFFLLDLSQDNL